MVTPFPQESSKERDDTFQLSTTTGALVPVPVHVFNRFFRIEWQQGLVNKPRPGLESSTLQDLRHIADPAKHASSNLIEEDGASLPSHVFKTEDLKLALHGNMPFIHILGDLKRYRSVHLHYTDGESFRPCGVSWSGSREQR